VEESNVRIERSMKRKISPALAPMQQIVTLAGRIVTRHFRHPA
jgi:hypothetical protein